MSTNFKQVNKENLKRLAQYVPVVARVHGGTHAEFLEVRKAYDELAKLINEAGEQTPNLKDVFIRLREITNNYTVPSDVCESSEAVYNMLSELDKSYEA